MLYLPAVFPYLVTGWVTAAGGAWNASIVAEYVTFKEKAITATGLGAQISAAAEAENFPLLAASVLVMSIVVVPSTAPSGGGCIIWRRRNIRLTSEAADRSLLVPQFSPNCCT